MEKLNAQELADILEALGESSTGGKSLLFTRLEAVLIERNLKFEDVEALVNVSKRDGAEGDKELAPGDSISQVGVNIVEVLASSRNNLGEHCIYDG